MPGLGTIINVVAIAIAGVLGMAGGKLVNERLQDGLVKASGVCVLFIGMAGALQGMLAVEDGMTGDVSILATKSVLDFIIILVMTCSLGKGSAFSAIPVGLFQGSVTALALFIKPFMTDAALAGLSSVGSILIFCVGVNLVWDTKLRVANMLPAVIIAPLLTFLPLGLW